MNPKNIHCPYCNADLNLSPEEAAGPRVRCPRCGDSFPNRSLGAANGQGLPTAPAAPDDVGPGLPAPTGPARWTNTAILRMLLGAMGGVALAALIFALATIPFRRERDYNNRPPSADFTNQPLGLVAPAELPALGYLPANCQALAGFHVAQMQLTEDGRDLLQKASDGPAELGLSQLKKWTGLRATDFDHLVLGIRLDQDLPQVTLVARTRRPYNPQTIAQALAPTKPITFAGRPVYRVRPQPWVEGLLWLRDDRTLVVEIKPLAIGLEDLKKLPAEPRSGAQPFPPALREGLNHPMLREAFLWTVGDLKEAPQLKNWLGMVSLTTVDLPPWLTKVDAFRAACRFQKGITLDAGVKGRDEATARQIQEYLDRHRPEKVDSYKVIGPASEPMAGDALDNTWVILQAHASPARVAEILGAVPMKGTLQQ